jgi:hypothetical protein
LTLVCPITVLPISDLDRNHTSVLARRERMTMLAELVDVVIGVDTHKHTHTAAVIAAATGAAGEDLTVGTDPDGYAELVAKNIEYATAIKAVAANVIDESHRLGDTPTAPAAD